MRKILIAALLLITIASYEQATIYKAPIIEATKEIRLRGMRVDSVSNDTMFISNSGNIVPTQFAVTNYVARMIRTNTASSLPWSSLTGIPTANGTTNGILSSSDWNGFNGKQTALNGTGFVKMSGTSVSYDNNNYFKTTGDSASWIWLPNKSIATAFPSSGVVMFDSSSRWSYRTSTFKTISFSTSKVTANTSVIDTFPDYSGTFVFKYNADSIFNKVIDGNNNTLKNVNLTSQVTGLLPDANISSASTWNAKQAALVSGTNIKTINSTSLLGSGNITVGDALVANPLSQFAATTSAQLASNLTNETGSGLAVFNSNPTFADSVTAPKIIGGTGTTSILTLQSTNSSSATTGADIVFKISPSTEAMRVFNNGALHVGYSSYQSYKLAVNGSAFLNGALQFGTNCDIGNARNINALTSINCTGSINNVSGGVTTTLQTSSGIGSIGTTSNHTFNIVSNSTANAYFFTTGNVAIGSSTDAGYKLDVNGTARATKFQLSALNTAPSSSSDTGTTGEIRIVNGFIYVCVATNTWQRAAIATF